MNSNNDDNDDNNRMDVVKGMEKISKERKQSQLCIETPYRNDKLLADMLKTLADNTLLCIACDITLATEFIVTKTVSEWKKSPLDLHKRPAIFILQA